MKKRLLSFIIALACLVLPVLTSCGDGEDYVPMAKVKPMTITLYGIKGEGTTDEAIKAVQDEMNEYTEGNLNTRVLLRLFTEDEYYAKLDEAFAKAQEYKDNKKNNGGTKPAETTEAAPEGSGDKTSKYEMVYPNEQGTQVDIFMVRGYEMFNTYANDKKLAATVSVKEKSGIIAKYISDRYIDITTVGGTPLEGGLLDKGSIKGIPNNTVNGEYTYLLVDKALAAQHYYAEKNLTTLAGLSNFLKDAASKNSDYITLYNAPELNVNTIGDALIGGVVTDLAHAYSELAPTNLLKNEAYVEYLKYLNLFTSKGYITEGDAHSLPENEKVAAAFIKGSSDVPAKYGDDYLVIPYAKPVMNDLGTVYCVSTYAANSSRCMEVISLLQTNAEYRNTFQYGVENVHYTVNDYTGIIEIISDDWNMNPADTGNIFLLKENSSMDETTRALAKNDWAVAKVHYRDTVVNPYLKFIYEPDEAFASIEEASKNAYSGLMAYKPGVTSGTFEAYASQLADALDAAFGDLLNAEVETSLASAYNKFAKTEKIVK